MKSELLPERDILELLTREIAPEQQQRWHRTDDRLRWMLWRDDVNRLLVAGLGLSSWYVGWEDGVRGSGDTIPAAVADFRRQVLADAMAVGAVKANPTSDYNNVEAAIYATAFAIQMEDARKKVTAPLSDGRADAYWLNAAKWAAAVAKDTVNNYRATIK